MNELNSLEEMDILSGTYDLPRLMHEEIKNLNRSIRSKKR